MQKFLHFVGGRKEHWSNYAKHRQSSPFLITEIAQEKNLHVLIKRSRTAVVYVHDERNENEWPAKVKSSFKNFHFYTVIMCLK